MISVVGPDIQPSVNFTTPSSLLTSCYSRWPQTWFTSPNLTSTPSIASASFCIPPSNWLATSTSSPLTSAISTATSISNSGASACWMPNLADTSSVNVSTTTFTTIPTQGFALLPPMPSINDQAPSLCVGANSLFSEASVIPRSPVSNIGIGYSPGFAGRTLSDLECQHLPNSFEAIPGLPFVSNAQSASGPGQEAIYSVRMTNLCMLVSYFSNAQEPSLLSLTRTEGSEGETRFILL
ncbi:unnamed protein product [Protopolystoma xenopodis]|uniref:Uncharacterized protein n=1 Tax=Protopolystoma xenopodis TaxID=117903 RepID=A0A448WW67_9PLAT|nr:unnamed protein product [Protopolystoma xenopodis]